MEEILNPEHANRPTRTSALLEEVILSTKTDWSVGSLSLALGERGLGMLLLLFSLASMIPVPGFASLAGALLLFFAVQIIIGRESIWMPNWLAKKPIEANHLHAVLNRALPWVKRIEHYVRPRLNLFNHIYAHKLTGILIAFEAIVIILPIPLGNFMPSLASVMMALGIVERDGLLAIIGWILCVVAVGYIYLLVSGYGWLIIQALENFF